MDHDLIARLSAPVPRYTSYPTAPCFSPEIGNGQYLGWLGALPEAADLSLYVHIPFCNELCWYCGCNTKAVQRYGPVARYLEALEKEAATVGGLVPPAHKVTHIHWGGGSPSILTAAHIRQLSERLRSAFRVTGGAELAVEVDPRFISGPQADAFAAVGMNRLSLGVQDFDEAVQKAINRHQPFEMTRRVVQMFRALGVTSINLDLVYGLPHQTSTTLSRTLDLVLELRPERIAAFGYAHLPARLKHQRLIETAALPGPADRYRLAELIAERLTGAGYARIGLDHFARPDDALARRPVARNFQGYTTDRADALIGLGASAIGRLPGAYVQNVTPSGEYIRRIERDGLAVARGLELSADDRMRAFVIERLMSDLVFHGREIETRFGPAARPLLSKAAALVAEDRDALLEGTADGFRVTERGRPFLRSICASFDAYLGMSAAQHAAGV